MPDAALVEALEKCREKFVFYVDQHLAKEPPDYAKAETNRDMVRLCDAALAQPALPREGWVTVPRELSHMELSHNRMVNAAHDCLRKHCDLSGVYMDTAQVRYALNAALAAAPPAPDLRGEVETDADLLARGWNIAAERAQSAEAQLAEARGELEREDKAHGETIDQRDAAEQALSQAYYLVTGRSPEWSNVFGHVEALEEIDDAQHAFRATISTLTAQRDEAREIAQCFTQVEKYTGMKVRAETAEARASFLTARLEALVGACKPFVEAAEPIEHDTGGRWNPDTWFKRTKALTVGDFRALKAAHDAALNGGAGK